MAPLRRSDRLWAWNGPGGSWFSASVETVFLHISAVRRERPHVRLRLLEMYPDDSSSNVGSWQNGSGGSVRDKFWEVDEGRKIQFSGSGGSMNGPDLFIELPFCGSVYKSIVH